MVGALPLTVTDDGSSRPDLAARRELKYVFVERDVASLRAVLLRTCRPVTYAGPVSLVSSLYFDDPGLGACRANFDGVGIRHKTRIRWYDSVRPRPGRTIYFETKWRRHRVVGKRRLALTSDADVSAVSLGTLHRSLCRALPPTRLDHLATDTEPVALIRYRREHFAFDGGAARLTLDYDIRFHGQIGHRRLSTRFARRFPGIALIECKTDVGDGARVHRALSPLRARPARFSKYVTACLHLGYARAS